MYLKISNIRNNYHNFYKSKLPLRLSYNLAYNWMSYSLVLKKSGLSFNLNRRIH